MYCHNVRVKTWFKVSILNERLCDGDMTLCTQVLHLVGVALLEEQQQLENSSGDDDVTFNYTCKITRQYLQYTYNTYSTHTCTQRQAIRD